MESTTKGKIKTKEEEWEKRKGNWQTPISSCATVNQIYKKKKKGNMSHSQITCKINRWELMKGKLRQNQREATQSISVYISIYRSSFILIFKPTKSCKYNFWMKGTGKIRQCWYNTQKKKIYYSTKRGQLVTHEQILPSWPSSRLGETEIQLTQQKRRGFRNKNPLAKLVFIAFPNWQKVTSALQVSEKAKK